jgi:hypothetical protein
MRDLTKMVKNIQRYDIDIFICKIVDWSEYTPRMLKRPLSSNLENQSKKGNNYLLRCDNTK